MSTLTKYDFTQQVDYSTALSGCIQQSSIITSLDHIETVGSGPTMMISIWFKDILSSDDETILNSIMSSYSNPSVPTPSNVVTTQFELRDKTLKLAHSEGDVTGDGTVTVLLKVPGTPGSSDGRWISSGTAFFDMHTPGDKILAVYFTDEDNILGNGAGAIVGSYTDDEVDGINQGWAITPLGMVKAEAIGGYGFAPAGFYIKIMAKKAGDSPSGKFYCNIEWGKTE